MATDEDGNIEYSGYSVQELQEARSSILSQKYPKNFANLVAELERRGGQLSEPPCTQETAHDDSTHMYSAQAKSPLKARVTGFLTLVFGIVWFLLRYDDGVYHGRRGREYTFDDDPVLLTFFLAMHGLVVLIGILGLIFGSGFYRELIQSSRSQSTRERKD